MTTLFSKLPKLPRRTFVPHHFDCSNLKQVLALYQNLLDRDLPTLSSVEQWLYDVQEISMVLGEYDSIAYVRKSVNTRDKKAQAAYLHLVQKIHPGIAPCLDKINKKLLAHPLRKRFPKRWALMMKFRQNEVDLFREKNIPLDQKIEETALEYSRLMGGLEVMFEGKRQTLVQMSVYLDKPDRELRQRAWGTLNKRRFEEKGKIDSIFDRLIQLRTRVAKNAGYKNFRDFCHQKHQRFDYKPADCFKFHDAVEKVVLPAVVKIRERRRQEMNLAKLKPWDLAADPESRLPLKPFRNGTDLAKGCAKVFAKLDRQLGSQFSTMIAYDLLDLDNRPGKEPGGYQTTLTERHLPFIFMNAVGRDDDLRVLLHEAGHAFHTFATHDEPILDYRHAPIEFCEVASMSMELLGNRHLQPIYPKKEDFERSRRLLFEGTIQILPWVATIDAFQHWIYTHPDHSRSERVKAWMNLRKRFSDGTDWSGYHQFEEVLWHRQSHLFSNPFYYIEYGMAQLGALMVWHRSLTNPAEALASYKRALKLGGSVGLPELFKAAGGSFKFESNTMRPLVSAVLKTLGL
jgi:oligoendopeptidase F